MTSPTFHGADYSESRDRARLLTQFEAVLSLMADGRARTLAEISAATGAPHASCSAQLRHIRAAGRVVHREHVGNGLYRYQLLPASEIRESRKSSRERIAELESEVRRLRAELEKRGGEQGVLL